MSEYMTALFFGAAIITIFAWDQFNRPSYDRSRELTRLIELLNPSDMRRRTVYWRAYVFYAGILLLIYATLCVYGALLFPVLGLDLPGVSSDAPDVGASELPTTGYDPDAILTTGQALSADAADGTAAGLAPDPIVPLTLSLIMVGLAPSVPILQRIEAKVRLAAHRLSGIPTRLVTGSRQLRARPLGLDPEAGTFLIPPQDWERLDQYTREAAQRLDDPDAFREDIVKLLAFRAWILQEKLQLDNHATRNSVSEIEVGIGKRIERLLFDLDALAGFGATPQQARGDDQVRAAWETHAREADLICADVCVLCMLYVEHGILPTEADADRLGWSNEDAAASGEAAQQRALAQVKLLRFVSDAARWADRDSISIALWVRATAAVLIVAFGWGFFFGLESVEGGGGLAGGSRIVTAFLYVLSALLTYALALLVAVSYHQAAYQDGVWRNVFRDNWAVWLPQVIAVFALSAFVAVVCHVGYNVYATIGAVGWETVRDNWRQVLRFALEYEGPSAMRGPVLAVLVILITDAWRNGAASAMALRVLPYLTAVVMLVVGFGSRIQSSQVAATARGKTLGWPTLEAPFPRCTGEPDPASSVVDWCVTWPPALAAGLLTGAIGLSVALLVRATLVSVFPRGVDRAGQPPAPHRAPLPRPGE